jgi:heptosyltransferase-1
MSEPGTGSGTDGTTAADQRPMRCLVIQLARLGDTVQSLMALRAAKQLYPRLEITFVARERFAAAARRVPWLASVVALPDEELLNAAARGEDAAVSRLATWVSPLCDSAWDLCVNWSFSEASSFLTGLIPAHVKLGYSRGNDLGLRSTDGWSHYLQAIVQGGIRQNIHLTDILTTQILTALQIHAGDPDEEGGESTATSKSFFELGVGIGAEGSGDWPGRDSSRRWIGLQLGAGDESKTWTPARWAELASLLLRRHPECGLVLLGGSNEEGLAQSVLAAIDPIARERAPILSFVGKTDFDLWASIIGQCQWLISGDTAAVHVASVLGTRVINVSVGPVRWAETGPYGNGNYVVASNLECTGCAEDSHDPVAHRCREGLRAESVYAVWAYASSEWAHRRQMPLSEHFRALSFEALLPTVRVCRSRIRGTDDGGGVVYEDAIPRPITPDEWTAQVMGHLARAWYCGWTPAVGKELERGRISPELVRSLRYLDESAAVLQRICEQAAVAAETLQRKSAKLRSERLMQLTLKQELGDLGKKILDLDRLIERLAPTHPAMRGFAQMAKVLMHNLPGEQLAELGRESAEAYRQLGQGARIVRDWIRHTLEIARPAVVAPAPLPN